MPTIDFVVDGEIPTRSEFVDMEVVPRVGEEVRFNGKIGWFKPDDRVAIIGDFLVSRVIYKIQAKFTREDVGPWEASVTVRLTRIIEDE